MNAQASSERVSLLGLTPAEFSAALEQSCDAELPRYRAEQVFEWVYRHRVGAFDQMTNLPADLQRLLARSCIIEQSDIAHQLRSADGTHKLLLRWSGGGTSECVLIPSPQRVTGCISTQVGCPVRCTFCASGIDGLKRNLSAGEIVEQAWRLSNMSEQLGQRLSNVVFMGLGEPLANFDATVRALRIINADWGLAIGARKITVSTVGLPRQMKMLADQELQITLALSLHAPTDELRRQLIPWAERVTIDELVDACRYYFERTGREVTIEFILLAGVNDAAHHADQLATLSKRMRSNVNLIPYNEVAGIGYRRPGDKSVAQFAERLKQQGVNCHVRRSRGRDIDAACGQLRRRVAAES